MCIYPILMKILDLKIGLRNLYRNKLYTLLNVLGLSIGMASAMLIFLWVQFQVSFDRYHENGENIYRVIQDQFYTNGEVFHVQVTPPGMSRLLKLNISSITNSTRYTGQQSLLQVKDHKSMEEVQLVDPDFFSMFSFPLVKGDPVTVFTDNHAMVISEELASKLFGEENPIGEIVLLEGQYPFTVTGVISDRPRNTNFKYNCLIPFEFLKETGVDVDQMGSNWITTYIQLTPGTAPETVNETIEAYKKQHFPESKTIFYLQPLKNIHLYWIWGGGPIKNVRLFSIIAVLLILIAAINFTNLSTAMATKRFREIGVKKTFGASRGVLIRQFLLETMVLTLLSLFVALILAESFLPWYNALLRTELQIDYSDWILIAAFGGILLITGLLSGAYPALYLSSFRPIQVLKTTGPANKRSLLRETLVVLQFGLAIVLIVNTIIIKKQQQYMLHSDVGIQKENILYLPVRGELSKQYEVFKALLLKVPEIKGVTISSHLPTGIGSNGGGYKWQGKPPEVDPLVSYTTVDGDYAATFGISMLEGEFYESTQVNDTNHVVINKAFADIIGLQPILGEVIEVWGLKLKVIGVTENFHFKSLSRKIEPLAMFCFPQYQNHIFCRIVSNDIRETIRRIEKIHNQINEKFPFEYHFLDAEYDNLYANEQRQGRIFNVFSLLAIFISCLGLFGLSSFMMAQRTKEIGVRKAHGARVLNIMTLFTRYYIKWVVVSFMIALPVSYYLIHNWLKNYAYRTPITWWVFAAAGLMALLIAVITVSWQSWRAANKNPVEALRYE